MAPAHLKPLTLLSATRPLFHTMTQFLHTLKQLPLCNSRTQSLSSETSDALLQNPPLLLHGMSKPGYSQALLDCTLRMSINFLGPIFLLESHFFGHISLDQLIPLLSTPSPDHQALQTAIQQFPASKRAKVEVAQIPRQPPPCGPPPPPAPPDPTSPHPQPPPPLPHSPSVPVPPPDTSSTY